MINNLGILGLGTSSTLHYVDELNKKFLQKFGGYSTCPFIMVNTNFNTINPFLPDQEIDLYKNLLPYLYFIEQISIKHLLVPNITIHEVLDKILEKHHFSFTLIHPVNLIIAKLNKNAVTKVIILGSLYTMQGNYIQNLLQENKITTIELDIKDQKKVDDLRKSIYNEDTGDSSLLENLLKKHPNVTFVLACTELSLLKYKSPYIIDLPDLQLDNAITLFKN